MRDLAEARFTSSTLSPSCTSSSTTAFLPPFITDTCETDRERRERSERHHHDTAAHSRPPSLARPPLLNKSSGCFITFCFQESCKALRKKKKKKKKKS